MKPSERISRRQVLRTTLLGSAALVLGACGTSPGQPTAAGAVQPTTEGAAVPGTSAAQAATLTVSSFYPVDQTSGWAQMVQEFQASHPNVTVETQVSSFEEYLPKLLTQKASNTLPDVVGVENGPFGRFAAAGILRGLNDYLDKDPDFNPDDFFPLLLERYTVDGTIYGIPYDAQPVAGVFINKTLFQQAGLPVPTNDWTWEQMLTAAEQLTQRDGDRVTVFGLNTGDAWANWVYAHGGRLVDNVQRPTTFTVDAPEAVQGMEAWVDLFLNSKVAPSSEYIRSSGLSGADLFATGRVAMFHGGYWELVGNPDKFAAIDLGYVRLPTGPSGEQAYHTGGTCYSVSAGSQQPDLAYAFLRFFMGMPGWQAAAKGSVRGIIYPPAYIPAYESELFLAAPTKPVENIQINGDAARYAIFYPAAAAWAEIQQKYVNPDLDSLVRGEKPVEPTMQQWAATFTPLLASEQ